MPLPGTPHTAKMALLWTTDNGAVEAENTFYLRDTSDAIFADPVVVTTGILAIANTTLRPIYYPQCSLVGMLFEDVRSFPFGGITVSQAPLAGTAPSSSQAMPSGCAIAVKKITSTLGRGGRGRWYHPLTDAHAIIGAQDEISAATATMIADGLSAFQTAVEAYASPGEMGLVSYFSGKSERIVGIFSQITEWTFSDLHVDSQRRRLAGRGR